MTINGRTLNSSESACLRVAVASMLTDLVAEEFPLGNDENGIAMTKIYKDRLGKIQDMIFQR